MVFSRVFNAASEAIGSGASVEFDPENFEFLGVEWRYFRYAGVITIIVFFISSLYYFLPNVKHSWLKTLPGAFIAAVGWFGIGKAFAYYLSNFDRLNLIYGSLGSIIAFLLFLLSYQFGFYLWRRIQLSARKGTGW